MMLVILQVFYWSSLKFWLFCFFIFQVLLQGEPNQETVQQIQTQTFLARDWNERPLQAPECGRGLFYLFLFVPLSFDLGIHGGERGSYGKSVEEFLIFFLPSLVCSELGIEPRISTIPLSHTQPLFSLLALCVAPCVWNWVPFLAPEANSQETPSF